MPLTARLVAKVSTKAQYSGAIHKSMYPTKKGEVKMGSMFLIGTFLTATSAIYFLAKGIATIMVRITVKHRLAIVVQEINEAAKTY